MRHKSFESRLEEGDLVQVRPIGEIFATLDKNRKFEGIAFTHQMEEYCGKTFRICKRATKIVLESTGELRTLKIPTVMLEGVICNGTAHGGCERSCLYLWPEIWLARARNDGPVKAPAKKTA